MKALRANSSLYGDAIDSPPLRRDPISISDARFAAHMTNATCTAAHRRGEARRDAYTLRRVPSASSAAQCHSIGGTEIRNIVPANQRDSRLAEARTAVEDIESRATLECVAGASVGAPTGCSVTRASRRAALGEQRCRRRFHRHGTSEDQREHARAMRSPAREQPAPFRRHGTEAKQRRSATARAGRGCRPAPRA